MLVPLPVFRVHPWRGEPKRHSGGAYMCDVRSVFCKCLARLVLVVLVPGRSWLWLYLDAEVLPPPLRYSG